MIIVLQSYHGAWVCQWKNFENWLFLENSILIFQNVANEKFAAIKRETQQA